MKKVHAKRLLKLADFLMTVPRERFDITTWAGGGWQGKADLSCGTTACAIGWATAMPEFRRLGLRLRRTPIGTTQPYLAGTRYSEARYWATIVAAVNHVFGLRGIEIDELFVPSAYDSIDPTPRAVASKIRRFVAREAGPKGSPAQ